MDALILKSNVKFHTANIYDKEQKEPIMTKGRL